MYWNVLALVFYEPSILANSFDVYGNIILPNFEGFDNETVVQESSVY